MKVLENVSLKPYTTFGIEARSRYFIDIQTVEELVEALAQSGDQEILILGGGSNMLLTKDFPGLAIRISIPGITIVREEGDDVWVKAGAGVVWHQLVLQTLGMDLCGLENLSLIPGFVGASPMQNIGAYGVEIKDVMDELEAVHRTTGERKIFRNEDCRFGYRESIFKHELKGQYVIVSVTFRLSRVPKLHIAYGDIQKTLQEMGVTEITPKAVSDAVIHIRQSKLPDPAVLGNAGSFFKNPEIPRAQYDDLKAVHSDLPGYPAGEGRVKVPAGWLIERAGWKGYRDGAVGVHDRQALVIVNFGGATGAQVRDLSAKVQASVFEKYGINLQPEVNFI